MNRLHKSDKALQMALEITGDYVQKSEVKGEYTSAEDKKQRAKMLLEKIAAKVKKDQESKE